MIRHAFIDSQAIVRDAALAAGLALVDGYGKQKALLSTLDEFLKKGSSSELYAENDELGDLQKEGAIVLLGAAARHLDGKDKKVSFLLIIAWGVSFLMLPIRKIEEVVDTLLLALRTPSEAVLQATADCLPPLTKSSLVKENSKEIIERLLQSLTQGSTYAERRGAAYGLAGMVKGLGLPSLRQGDLNVIDVLEAAASNNKSGEARQGALFAIECLCMRLGMLFEPYVIRLLPLLLKSFGDSNKEVAQAADYAAKMVMSKLTAHGVKRVMPAVLDGLSESKWQPKQASLRMLGAMSSCAPKQLSACLPKVCREEATILTSPLTFLCRSYPSW